MLVLFDQNTPVGIGKSLPGHVVRTARQQGWDTLANGELLPAAEEAGFNILLTADQNLAYQQNPEEPENRDRDSQWKPMEQRQEGDVANCRCRGLRSAGNPYRGRRAERVERDSGFRAFR